MKLQKVGENMKKKVKNAILKALTTANAASLFLMACCLDSKSLIPALIMFINIVFIVIIGLANS